MYKINNQLFDTASATTAVAKQQHKRLPKSQVVDARPRRGRQPGLRQPHLLLCLLFFFAIRKFSRACLTFLSPGPSVAKNSISSFDSPTLSKYGSKFRGFIFQIICPTLYFRNAINFVYILVYRENF